MINTYNLENLDILKVAHHGSNTSSGSVFLLKTKPKFAIFQVGKNNRFGHPHVDVVKRLEEMETKILDTSKLGSIQFILNENRFELKWCNS